MFEGSTASGAERAYKKALNKLTEHLVDADVLGVVELKLTDKNKKIAAAAYEYKAVHRYANDDDEWGEIRLFRHSRQKEKRLKNGGDDHEIQNCNL